MRRPYVPPRQRGVPTKVLLTEAQAREQLEDSHPPKRRRVEVRCEPTACPCPESCDVVLSCIPIAASLSVLHRAHLRAYLQEEAVNLADEAADQARSFAILSAFYDGGDKCQLAEYVTGPRPSVGMIATVFMPKHDTSLGCGDGGIIVRWEPSGLFMGLREALKGEYRFLTCPRGRCSALYDGGCTLLFGQRSRWLMMPLDQQAEAEPAQRAEGAACSSRAATRSTTDT